MRLMSSRSLLLVALAVVAALAPASLGSAQDFGARVSPAGLAALTDEALNRVPSVFPIERLDPTVASCPGDDVVAHIPDTDVMLNIRALEIETDDGAIRASTTLDISVANTIQIENANACLGDAVCDLSANLERLSVAIELAAATDPSGGIAFHGASVELDLSADDLAIESEGCALGDVATFLFDAFEEWALNLLTPRLEAMIGERLSGALSTLFAETVSLEVEVQGFAIAGTLDTLDFSRADGVTLEGSAAVTWSGEAIYDDPAPMTAAPEGPPIASALPGDFQIAVADRMVTDSLYQAWRGGLIRRLLADQALSIELAGDGAVAALGLAPGTEVDLSFDLLQPPTATFGRAGADVAEVAIDQLHAVVVITAPSGNSSTVEIFVSGAVQAALTVNPELNGLVLDVQSLELRSVRIEGANEQFDLSAARLERLVAGTVMPMLGERLRGLPVAPGLNAIAGTFVHVRAVTSAGGWQRVGVDLVRPNPDDATPPDTSLRDPATLLSAGTAAFDVSGTDDDSPAALLRYVAWLDGAPLAEGEASSLTTVRFDVTGGEHTLEVAAVDLNDNRDPSPVAHTFTVDATPPTLDVTSAPSGIVAEASVAATWQASDPEGGPVQSRWVLREVGADSMATIIQESPFGADGGALEIGRGGLTPGALYELEIVVRDEAGNLTSETFGFALDGSAGCSVGAVGAPRPAPVVLLGLLAAALLGSRRRR